MRKSVTTPGKLKGEKQSDVMVGLHYGSYTQMDEDGVTLALVVREEVFVLLGLHYRQRLRNVCFLP